MDFPPQPSPPTPADAYPLDGGQAASTPPPSDSTDPLTAAIPPRSGVPWWLWALSIAILIANVALQRPDVMSEDDLNKMVSGKLVTPPGGSPEIAIAKIVVAYHNKPFMNVDLSTTMLQSMEPQPPMAGMPVTKYDFAQDRFRVALLHGKLGKPEVMKERFTAMRAQVDPESPLLQDMETATAILEHTEVDAKAQDAFLERHGWFAKMLLDNGEPNGVVAKAKEQGARMFRAIMIAMVVFGLVVVLGIICLGVFIVLMATGRIKPFPTMWRAPPGYADTRRLWLETVAAFLVGFLVLQVVGEVLKWAIHKGTISIDPNLLVSITLIAQWMLALLVFWPLLRGMPAQQFRAELGWHRGRGFLHEIGVGIFAYLALLPLYMMMAIVVVICMMIYYAATGAKQAPLPTDVIDLAGGKGWQLVLIFSLVTVWAPVVEESIFRGACYRFVRARAGLFIAAFASACAFAVLHGYLVPQLILVGTLGFGFALMREWRGSLLPSMTGHFLHNALIFTFISSIAPIMGD